MALHKKIQRAGIIPYSTDNGEILFLFGKERFGKWGSFSGRREKDETPEETAIREGAEEIMGFLSPDYIRDNISDKDKIVVELKDSISHYYFIEIYYDYDLPFYFKNVTDFLVSKTKGRVDQYGIPILCDNCNGLLEKTEVDWFSMTELKSLTSQQISGLFNSKSTKLVKELISGKYI